MCFFSNMLFIDVDVAPFFMVTFIGTHSNGDNIELSAWPVLSIIRIGAFYHALVFVWIGSANKWHCGKEATLIL